MNIDKSKLQPLLWAVVGAWKTGDQGLQLHTDALDQFLGEHTVEQVALQLLAELSLAGEARDAYAADKKSLAFALSDARAEAEALRKDAEYGRLLSYCHGNGTLEMIRSNQELLAEVHRLKILAGEPVPPTSEEFVGPSSEGPTARIRRRIAVVAKEVSHG